MPAVELDPSPAEGAVVEPIFTPPPKATAPALPTPTATLAVASQYHVGGGVEQWRDLVASIFPAENVDSVLRVMSCESGGNAGATGAAGERGLMQIHPLHFDSTYDPEGNLRAAYRISGGGYSWAAWSCKP